MAVEALVGARRGGGVADDRYRARRRRHGPARWVAALAFACGLALSTAAPAGAASTGWIYSAPMYVWNEWLVRYICVQADVIQSQGWSFNSGFVGAFHGNPGAPCSSIDTVGAGTFAVNISGYRNGSFCGWTGNTYNPWPVTQWGTHNSLCAIAIGWNRYSTKTDSIVYNSAGTYVYHGPAWIDLWIYRAS